MAAADWSDRFRTAAGPEPRPAPSGGSTRPEARAQALRDRDREGQERKGPRRGGGRAEDQPGQARRGRGLLQHRAQGAGGLSAADAATEQDRRHARPLWLPPPPLPAPRALALRAPSTP